ncbi:hypothetical protein P3T37_002329 [Kitasatospora sp. MAA4]|uniref:cupin domain-containing protein n=1 Tax=Kitasatospora sp. MAA4 TaxID=3035093 RepID=UPI002473075E|nr:cupin domain-containing protein [Kitasatospora sp. MAA4]MDH6132943.1 hypothetical protein [Kitasatospora sp. MAA4]
METYSFEDFVGSRDEFLAEYFNKKPLLRTGALAGRLEGLPSVRQLDDILALETTPPSYLRVTKGGKGVPSSAYTRTVARGAALAEAVNPQKVYELFRSGGTVTWNALNHVLPSARRLAQPFTEALACEAEVVLFATPARTEGFSPHRDSIDVYVVQVDGTKTWRVWDTPQVRPGDEGSYTLEELGDPVLEVTLTPGDVLYVPHGTPHAAAARSELSVHLSVGVKPRRWRDLVKETVAALVEDDEFHAFPCLGDGRHETASAELAGRLRVLTERLAGLDAAAETRRLAALGRAGGAAGKREFARLAAVDAVAADTLVRRSAMPVQIGAGDGGRTGIQVNGHRLAVPDAVAAAIGSLAGGHPLPAAELLPGAGEARSLAAARQLARLGVLEVVGPAEARDVTESAPTGATTQVLAEKRK